MEAIAVNDVISGRLSDMNKDVSTKLNGDCVFVCSDLFPPLDNVFREIVEELKSNGDSDHLVVLLETEGGYLEIVERMVLVMREHYSKISFVVPSHAYSAGTVLVLSGDSIYMDYYSVLGPIDPQYDGLPGAGYLVKFKELMDKINQVGTTDSRAELAYLVRRFAPAKLFFIEQSIEHGRSLIAEWLPKYKFKNWEETETDKRPVSVDTRQKRAEEIAKKLGDAERWHSHGKGITMKELRGDEIKLKIDDFGQDSELSQAIRNYHGLCVDFVKTSGKTCLIHSFYSMREVF